MSVQDMARALERRDEGIASSAQHAEEVQPGWGERAYRAVQCSGYLASESFTMDFARQWLYACGLDIPPEERAWGAVTQKLVRDGIIEPVGYAPAASSNGSPKRTYRLKVQP